MENRRRILRISWNSHAGSVAIVMDTFESVALATEALKFPLKSHVYAVKVFEPLSRVLRNTVCLPAKCELPPLSYGGLSDLKFRRR